MREKNSFVLYTNYKEQLKYLSYEEVGKLMMAVFEYEETEKMPTTLEGMACMAFLFIKQRLDEDNNKYKEVVEKRKRAGKQGATAKQANATFAKEEQAKQAVYDNVYVNDSDNDSDNDNDNVNDCVNDSDKELKDVSSEPEETPATEPTSPTVAEIVLNDKSKAKITQAEVDEWKKLYPAVDVLQELRKMTAWCEANPTKRKTKRGIKAFIVNWLNREQDKGKKEGKGSGQYYRNCTAVADSNGYKPPRTDDEAY